MTNPRSTCRAVVALVLMSLALPAAAAADGRGAARGCTPGVLRGPYTFSFSGTVVTPPFPAIPTGPFAAVGRLVFNGDGTFASALVQSFNGVVLPLAITSGSYTIDADCTGSAWDSNGGAYAFVVSQRGRSIEFILTNPGVVATGKARVQS